jgi:hypothetical protein
MWSRALCGRYSVRKDRTLSGFTLSEKANAAMHSQSLLSPEEIEQAAEVRF